MFKKNANHCQSVVDSSMPALLHVSSTKTQDINSGPMGDSLMKTHSKRAICGRTCHSVKLSSIM